MSRIRLNSFEPVDLAKAFDIAVEATSEVAPPVPIPTGLSDEEDALRHMALRFNPDLAYCPNCETPVRDKSPWCPYCGDTLRDLGTVPRKRKLPNQ